MARHKFKGIKPFCSLSPTAQKIARLLKSQRNSENIAALTKYDIFEAVFCASVTYPISQLIKHGFVEKLPSKHPKHRSIFLIKKLEEIV